MDVETVKNLASEIAENIIDKYLDVTDVAEDVDVTEFTAENTEIFASEVARVIEAFVTNAVRSAQEE